MAVTIEDIEKGATAVEREARDALYWAAEHRRFSGDCDAAKRWNDIADDRAKCVTQLRSLLTVLNDLLAHAVNAWDETDIDGPYQTKAFKEAIKRAEDVFG